MHAFTQIGRKPLYLFSFNIISIRKLTSFFSWVKIVIHFQNFHLPLEFSSGTNQTNVYHLFPNRNFREFVVNGKQPLIILMTIMLHFNLVPKLLSGYSSSPRQRLLGRTVGKTLIEFLYTTDTSLRIHMFPYG